MKEKPLTSNTKIIERLAEEIRKAALRNLIIVHGGGSFGHPLAQEYDIASGYKNSRQLVGFSKTHQAMAILNRQIVDALIQRNVPAVEVQPSAFVLTRRGRIMDFSRVLIQKMMDMSLVPVLYGDSVIDEEQGFSILSGDQLMSILATNFQSPRIILCVDVDGLFTEDPKLHPEAKLIRKISLGELKTVLEKIGKSTLVDVTGGMHGKVTELIPALEMGVKVELVNAKKPNRLYKALLNQEVKGTKIEP
ncbi:isopentenyl phosphate kinase [Candidatus Bathyarchaeota archaeon]|nr:isopentenyl phosphate kinase [Candidatus Bathyarchaeota archaeon]